MAPREDLVFSAQARTIIKCTLTLPVVLRLHVSVGPTVGRHTEHTFHTLAQINDLGSGGVFGQVA